VSDREQHEPLSDEMLEKWQKLLDGYYALDLHDCRRLLADVRRLKQSLGIAAETAVLARDAGLEEAAKAFTAMITPIVQAERNEKGKWMVGLYIEPSCNGLWDLCLSEKHAHDCAANIRKALTDNFAAAIRALKGGEHGE